MTSKPNDLWTSRNLVCPDSQPVKPVASERLGLPDLGVGVGLRVPHYRHVLQHRPAMDFFEIISENFMVEGGLPRFHLDRVREHYPVVQHGVSLNIGGPDGPRPEYLARLKQLHAVVGGPWLSDHLCWTGVPGKELHDLLPLPATQAMLSTITERARRVQDYLGVRLALENPSSYLAYTSSSMSEWEFLAELSERADIGLLLDVNNVYVAAYNHGFDPYVYINGLPLERVVQIHIAGHTNMGAYIVDTHTGAVAPEVWQLYRYTIERAGAISTLVEWDSEIEDFARLAALRDQVVQVRGEALAARAVRVRRGESAALELRTGKVPEQAPADRFRSPHRLYEVGGPRELAATHAARRGAAEVS